ncbi:MAG: type IX secretion system outer membrane channel protein PorV [Bacteroidia bacterium]|nr:type IX secretion system outer membrane channel protein PorV [Bacteroidia bacterium]
MYKILSVALFLFYLIFNISLSIAQSQPSPNENLIGQDDQTSNPITTAVPFLLIAPESRGGGMGDAGVATSPDVNSMHYNPAKYAFMQKDLGVAVSYSPWLRALVPDINLAYLAGYKRIDKAQVVAASLRYFSLGSITFTNEYAQTIKDFNPNEFAVDGTYSRLFSQNISGAVSLRYIYSNLAGGVSVGGAESHPGHSIATDVSFYYQKELQIQKKKSVLGIGINASNIGSKISYTDNADKDFIPINLKLGAALTTELDDYNTIMITAEVNKLMVPTPPIYMVDTLGAPVKDSEGHQLIAFGKDPDVSVPTGMFRSFWDAPGVYEKGKRNVMKEELREFTFAYGIEYWYSKQFALRTGYFHEDLTKGNRNFFTFGLGLRLNVFGLDFAYLIPTHMRNNPLANTLRFTLTFDFEGLKDNNKIAPTTE